MAQRNLIDIEVQEIRAGLHLALDERADVLHCLRRVRFVAGHSREHCHFDVFYGAFVVVLGSLNRIGNRQIADGTVGCRVADGVGTIRSSRDQLSFPEDHARGVNIFSDDKELLIAILQLHG